MIPASYVVPAAVILTLGGFLSCFAGYRMFRVVLGVYGLILGASITTSFMGSSNLWALVLAAVVGGLFGAILMIAAYFVGVGLIGAGLSALALNVGWHASMPGEPPTFVLVIVCVLGALLALSMVRYVVVFGTALAGAWTIIIGVLALMGDPASLRIASARDVWVFYPLDPGRNRFMYTAVWFALSLGGVVVQLATTTSKGQKKKK